MSSLLMIYPLEVLTILYLALYIFVGCSRHRVPFVLLDNGYALNICSLATVVALGFGPSNFKPSSQTVRAYDNTSREVLGTLTLDLQICLITRLLVAWHVRVSTKFIPNVLTLK